MAVSIMLLVAGIHAVRLGSRLSVEWRGPYAGYASDVLVPFGIYYLLVIREDSLPWVRPPMVKALVVFALAAVAETLQGLGIPALGVTFDPLDYLMYAAGALGAVLLDVLVVKRWLPSRPLVVH